MHDGNVNTDTGRRDLPETVVTPDTTLRELICARYEDDCFDAVYFVLRLLQEVQPVVLGRVSITGGTQVMLDAVQFGLDVDTTMFAPIWLQRIRELLDEIAKENGYEPPGHPGADASRPDPSHED